MIDPQSFPETTEHPAATDPSSADPTITVTRRLDPPAVPPPAAAETVRRSPAVGPAATEPIPPPRVPTPTDATPPMAAPSDTDVVATRVQDLGPGLLPRTGLPDIPGYEVL